MVSSLTKSSRKCFGIAFVLLNESVGRANENFLKLDNFVENNEEVKSELGIFLLLDVFLYVYCMHIIDRRKTFVYIKYRSSVLSYKNHEKSIERVYLTFIWSIFINLCLPSILIVYTLIHTLEGRADTCKIQIRVIFSYFR